MREGVYAINLALFVVITEDHVYRLKIMSHHESKMIDRWREMLLASQGFDPVVIGGLRALHLHDPDSSGTDGDTIGVVTVQDGPTLDAGQIIAPPVGIEPNAVHDHGNFQDIEEFLSAGGRRGRQFAVLTDGTYFINRWFATVETNAKTVVPIGQVGVVVSYFGKEGSDVSGEAFRHGERVASGERGVQAKTLSPGKYAFNEFAGHVHLVPTTNFVLHWITGRTESHKYDESLKSIDLVTADAYEPALPLSVVVHIDYQKAASVVQRFGDVKKLITQTLDPLLSAYFRDIAHKKRMLELLHDRDLIQAEARQELQRKFCEFDIELVDVLIGKPETREATGEIETLLEQLRLRQLSREQVHTYEQQCTASEKLKTLKMAQAQAEMQTELTQSRVEIEIAKNRGEAELEQARMRAEQTVVDAEADHRKHLLVAEAESKAKALLGEGESTRVALEGNAQAKVLRKQIESYGDPRLYAVSMVSKHLAQSRQPLVPSQLFTTGISQNGDTTSNEQGPLGLLIELLLAEKVGFQTSLPVPDFDMESQSDNC
ncbi:MAG: SPFH domain-containing protein [Pirellulaceae bacterium]|nr:SPFH domain-containing protein [Pirellulaceae bacterium]